MSHSIVTKYDLKIYDFIKIENDGGETVDITF